MRNDYPNPVREVLSIKVLGLSEGIVYSLEIYDVFGLSPGIYLAVVGDKNHFIGSAKFVVVR